MTLNELIARLRQKDSVDAVAIMGSAAEGSLNEASDYDLLIVLRQTPLGVAGGATLIEGRFTDIMFFTPEDIERLNQAGQNEIPTDGIQGSIIRWMHTARIEFDKCGCLERLQESVRAGLSLKQPGDGEMRSRWDKASYNVAQTRRMVASDDPVYHMAVDLRLHYQLSDLMFDYFRVRGLPWQGEKSAIRYWRSNDPDYLDLFTKCIDERDRQQKVNYYGELAALTMQPVDALWPTGATVFRLSPDSEMTRDNLKSAEAFWQSLLD